MNDPLFGSAPVGSAVFPCPLKTPVHWIEIELLGEDDKPIPWERYKVILPDGASVEGYLDGNGLARVEQIPSAGNCMVSFPDLDKDAWEPFGE